MTTLPTPLGQQVNTILAADTPLLIERPSGPTRIQTVRGGLGTPQNQDNPSSSQLSYAAEQLSGAQQDQTVVFVQETGDARILKGNRTPQTFAGDTDVDPSTDEITLTGHKLVTGDGPFQLTTAGTLPTGLALATDYFAIVQDEDTIQLALTRQDALDGTQMDITADGTGNSTLDGTHNISFAPASSVQDGSSGVLISAGKSLVVPADQAVTLVGDTGAVTSFFYP